MKPPITTTKVLYQISLMSLLMILSTIMSCNKDEEDPQTSDLIIGTWTVESVTIDLFFNDQSLVQYLMDQFDISLAEAELLESMLLEDYLEEFTGSINIKDDNTYVINFGDEVDSGTWEWSADGETITFDKGTNDEMEATIIQLNSTELIIEMIQTAEEDVDEDGIDDDVTMEIKMTLTK